MLGVFLLGASGYLGGTILTDLEKTGKYNITCLVREQRLEQLSKRGCKALLGSHASLELIESTSFTSDIVINAATSDDLELTKAINRGLAKRAFAGRSKGILIHISGTQLIESAPTGKLEAVPKYDDLDLLQIESISGEALHRRIDLEVVRSDLAGEITASIICPGVIFGRGTGPCKTISSPFPGIVRLALAQKRVIYAEDGSNIWCHVHVQDVSDLIMLSIAANLKNKQAAGFQRFYFAESGEHQKLAMNTDLAVILYEAGLVNESTPLSVPVGSTIAPSWANKTTSRCYANRARKELGWTPKILLEDTFKEEILDVLDTVTKEQ